MPNHVTNGVSIRHEDAQKLKKFADKAIKKNDDGDLTFDFNAIKPMPKHSETFFRDGGLGQDERTKYGENNWYDWSVKNWGTKWNAYSFKLISRNDNAVHIQFDTAWAPPTPIFEKLVEKGFQVDAVSINEDSGVEPDYFGEPENFYVERVLEFFE